VAFEFEKGLTWLTDIKDADDAAILGEGGEKVCVMG
jgi:hypothetical protein